VTPAPGELEVGRVGGAHGVRGEVTVTFVSNRPERVEPGAVMRAADRTLVIATARPHQGKWLVRFEGFDDRTAAETLRGALLVADPLPPTVALGDGEFWVHELIGTCAVTGDGIELGLVLAVEANPAHDLLVLEDDVLIPITFVVERRDDGTVVVDVPDGLLDL